MEESIITLAHGAGGREMDDLIRSFGFNNRGSWKNCFNDSASIEFEKIRELSDSKASLNLVFTTDSFIVDPPFFPGADIGHLAFSGTVNDLLMMGSKPFGISLGLVIEEGFKINDLKKIIESIKALSKKYNIPVVTGDTKVMEKGKVDKIMINTSGVGLVSKEQILTKKIIPGDKIIISGGLGEHAVALLSKRFDYQTDIESDSKPLVIEMDAIKEHIKIAKDITRGGIAAVLNEICEIEGVGLELIHDKIPSKKQVKSIVEMLGLNLYDLACEGRLICVATPENVENVLNQLKKYNPEAEIIGEVVLGDKVVIQTDIGKRILPKPIGRIVPRIC